MKDLWRTTLPEFKELVLSKGSALVEWRPVRCFLDASLRFRFAAFPFEITVIGRSTIWSFTRIALKKAGYTLDSAEITIVGTPFNDEDGWTLVVVPSGQRFRLEGKNFDQSLSAAAPHTSLETTFLLRGIGRLEGSAVPGSKATMSPPDCSMRLIPSLSSKAACSFPWFATVAH